MIVPSIQLVTQGYNDFKEYAEFFNTECVWGGGKLVESANLTIGTFQSLIKFIEIPKRGKTNDKYNPKFFNFLRFISSYSESYLRNKYLVSFSVKIKCIILCFLVYDCNLIPFQETENHLM